ncbi:hypothetical protein Dimus_020885 [Dionaea muscipula]
MTVTHLKKKDVVKSKVRGVDLEFDNEKLATILGVPGKNGICEYIKEVWEESKYTKPLEITKRFANDATIMKARRVRSVEMKPSRRFIHFTVMKNVIPRFGKRDTSKLHGFDIYGSLNGKEVSRYATSDDETHELCDLHEGSGENRRRDDDEAAQEEEAEGEDEGNRVDFGGRRSLMRQADEGESGSGRSSMMLEEEARGSPSC